MTKRIQIPIEDAELDLLKAAAQRAGQPLAAWARALLRERASEQLGGPRMSPAAALEALFALEAPVADIDTMIEESVRGRLS